jgi:hypothetical protein
VFGSIFFPSGTYHAHMWKIQQSTYDAIRKKLSFSLLHDDLPAAAALLREFSFDRFRRRCEI